MVDEWRSCAQPPSRLTGPGTRQLVGVGPNADVRPIVRNVAMGPAVIAPFVSVAESWQQLQGVDAAANSCR